MDLKKIIDKLYETDIVSYVDVEYLKDYNFNCDDSVKKVLKEKFIPYCCIADSESDDIKDFEKCIEYLKQEDPSLHEVFEITAKAGNSLEHINSCDLASYILQERCLAELEILDFDDCF